ncbi:hypothetical protein D3C81_2283700 [compost metagenome]
MSLAIRCTFSFCPRRSNKALAAGNSAKKSTSKSFLPTAQARSTLYRKYKSATLRLLPAT